MGYLRHTAWSMYHTLNGLSKAMHGRTLLELVDEDPEKAWALIRRHISEPMLQVLVRNCCGLTVDDMQLSLHSNPGLGGQAGPLGPDRRVERIRRVGFEGLRSSLYTPGSLATLFT